MKDGILFVDDEPNIIQGIRRMMFPFRKEWNLFYAIGAEEALEIIRREQIAIIISDMRMPKIDGVELLGIVKNEKPEIIRVILTGQSEKEKLILSSNLVHRCLFKPCKTNVLISSIKELLESRKDIEKNNLMEILDQLGELPVLPEVYLQLQEELNSPVVSIQKIVNIISREPMIVAKVLQLVNSSFFGLPVKIINLMQAINYIGISIIKTLVLYSKLFSTMKLSSENQAFIEKVWSHSIEVANLVLKILKNENADKSKTEEAYIAGILHDIGKAFLIQTDSGTDYNTHEVYENSEAVIAAERKIYNSDHAVVGSYILGLWKFSNGIVEAVKYHHTITTECPEEISVRDIILISNVIVEGYQADIEILNRKYGAQNIEKWKNYYVKKED